VWVEVFNTRLASQTLFRVLWWAMCRARTSLNSYGPDHWCPDYIELLRLGEA